MIISPDILRKEMVLLLNQINEMIEEVQREAKQLDILPHQMRDYYGGWVLIPLLAAKVSAISTLAQLNEPRERKLNQKRER